MAIPLRKQYLSTHPYVVERYDYGDDIIGYEIWDYRVPDAWYCRMCGKDVTEPCGVNCPHAREPWARKG